MDVIGTLEGLDPILQAFIAGLFTWFMTAAGAGLVFFFAEIDRKMLDGMLGFAAGVMIAASCFGLLGPAIDQTPGEGLEKVLPAAFGFILGGVGMRLIDAYLPHLHPGAPPEEVEGIKTTWHRSKLLISAITLHNIPEGLAVGVAFGAAASGDGIGAAIALSIGIGIQNFPEGAAVSVPLRREGLSRKESFWWGQLSALVEPISAVIGAAAIIYMTPILPYALAFAAGAMIFVVVEELVPEAHRGKNGDIATMGLMVGFTIMMVLDVALG
ncbi:MAG: ZIP family metal transporter [Euryarchaeota archaeon]|nr:ZIP family metal transporter [Euryarchaeota archaeon]|tara:strand:- start:20930 stop:21739 length:810 start_codon:yes stop_codon:yes gene_type:complete